MNNSSETKKMALAILYRKMSTDELTRRIAEKTLVPTAQEVAETELHSRLNQDTPKLDIASPLSVNSQSNVWWFALALVIGMAFSWIFLPRFLSILLLLIVIPAVAAPVGKAFPRCGVALAVVFAALPIALGIWTWKQGDLSFGKGDFKNLGSLVAWVALLFVSVLSWSVSAMLIFGSRHQGTWVQFGRKLEQIREEQLDSIAKSNPH